MARYDYNLVVIGGGSAGLIAALIAATVKAKVALIEHDRMGGDCLNTGCVPSKALLAAARVAHDMRTADRFGIGGVTPDVRFDRVMAHVRGAIATIAPKDSMERYRGLGVECIAGHARLVDRHTVQVGDRRLRTRSVVLAAGARPVVPHLPGLDAVDPLTSENLWDLEERPRRLLVMGAGPIGCELAQAFSRLGSEVTLIDLEKRLLPREDPEAGTLLQAIFEREGIDVRLLHRAVRVEADPDSAGAGQLFAETPDGATTLRFDRILVAVGRRPSAEGLGLEEAGIRTGPTGAIEVDDYLRTAAPNVFACGDVAGPYQFTHMASHQAWFAAVNALFGWARKFKVNYSVVPWATYTDPEVARVGLSEEDALKTGQRIEVTRYGFDDLDRAVAEGATEGFVKVLTAPGTDRILGATVVGAHAGELLAEYVLAMTHGLGLKRLLGTIHVYPTLAENAKLTAGAWRRARAPQGLLNWVGRLHALRRQF
jgi:pyruvate/2-oxoglutarate dehydrogenase complex dihydrolipoamide dehydrogenase (E3) component